VNEGGVRHGSILFALLIAGLLLTAVAWLRGAEYDEQYTLFLTGSVTRPAWPSGVITAGEIRALQAPQASIATIAHNLRATDVHPPLYFWTVAAWRRLAGNSLFEARLASVLFGIITLSLVATIARSAGIPATPAVLLTVGCYGFAYTGAIARGFAMAQMLSLAGVALLINARPRPWFSLAAGVLLGAATFANDLAAFVACAALFWLTLEPPLPQAGESLPRTRSGVGANRRVRVLLAFLGFALWLPADLWFFLAQRQSRAGQFASFEPISALGRLAQYAGATLFGGLPLYTDGIARTAVTTVLAVLLVALIALTIQHRHRIATPAVRLLFALCAAAPPVGLMLLGLTFDNTPIELRYLAFATPFLALLLAVALPRYVRHVVLAVQAIALVGLMTRPETMQPARATATAAASLARNGVVLLPHGKRRRGHRRRFRSRVPADTAPAGDRRTRNACGYPRTRLPVSSRRSRSSEPGRREPRDASRHARGVRGSVLAPGERRVQRARIRPDLRGGMRMLVERVTLTENPMP
jgi:uncharacterized membrane protein